MATKGFFKPNNPEKYVGDLKNIVYRSGWELKFMVFLDKSPNVIKWASEELSVCYYDPTMKKIRRYFPDFMIEIQQPSGKKKLMIEIKPLNQTIPPKKNKQKTPQSKSRYLKESVEFARNMSKWKAARLWCEERGYEFKIITENELFGASAG